MCELGGQVDVIETAPCGGAFVHTGNMYTGPVLQLGRPGGPATHENDLRAGSTRSLPASLGRGIAFNSRMMKNNRNFPEGATQMRSKGGRLPPSYASGTSSPG